MTRYRPQQRRVTKTTECGVMQARDETTRDAAHDRVDFIARLIQSLLL